MKRILFILGDYYPIASANGVCSLHIQKALYESGIGSDVICYGKKDGLTGTTTYGRLYTIVSELNNKKGRISTLVKEIFKWPVNYPNDILAYRRAVEYMIKKYGYDAVITVMKPIESALACSTVSNVILYELDSITNNGENNRGWRKFFRYRTIKFERQIYDNARYIFHLKCHSDYYSKVFYDRYRDKWEFTDIPHIVDEEYVFQKNSNGRIKIVYTGSLLNPRNDPHYSVELLKKLSNHRDIECRFFSRGNCENILANANKETHGMIRNCGYVSQDKLKNEMQNADVFLSIGFMHSGEVTSIPSKIFSYMSTGKPIIHVRGSDNDTGIPYLEKYENAVIIDPKENIDINVEKVLSFLNSNLGKRLDIENIRSLFPMNTPEYTAKRIIDIISEWEEKDNE